MEKRVLLAFILSSLIFVLWQKMFPSPQLSVPQQKAQTIENKQVADEMPAETDANKTVVLDVKKQQNEEEKVFINNGKIEAELTTLGGTVASVRILDYDAVLPVTDVFQIKDFADLDYSIEAKEPKKVVFTAQDRGFIIRKIFSFSDGDFLVNAEIQIQNTGKSPQKLDSKIKAMTIDMSMAKNAIDNSRDRNLLEYSVYSQDKVFRKTGAYKFTSKENKTELAPAGWFGFRDRYYCAIVKPEFLVKGYEFFSQNSDGKKLEVYIFSEAEDVDPGETKVFLATLFVGPQNLRLLKAQGGELEKIQVYFRSGFLDAIAKIIEDLMILMHKMTSNWGVSIILVSLMIYFAMYPMTMKSMLSMRKMQGLQPKIMELRTKHEKNPQKLNQEIMKLYAENKVNPVGGCLPLLLQMPVFICLYQMIWRSILFKGSGFLWIKDLSEPDRLFVLNQSFPVIGNEINLLPAIILVLMVVQQKMTSKNMVITDPNQMAQQKMMTFMMPIVLLLVFYRIASGLTLYLVVFYIMSSFTQWRVAKITSTAV